ADLSRPLAHEHVEAALKAGARGLEVEFLARAVETSEDEHRAAALRASGRTHKIARQSFALERDLHHLDALRHLPGRGDERLTQGAPPSRPLAAERVGEIFRRAVVHGCAQEMTARADPMAASLRALGGATH